MAGYAAGIPHHEPEQTEFTINLKHPRATEVFKRLIKISDVVLDNFSPGVMGG